MKTYNFYSKFTLKKKLGSKIMSEVITIFGVIIVGFIVVTLLMQYLGRNLPQN